MPSEQAEAVTKRRMKKKEAKEGDTAKKRWQGLKGFTRSIGVVPTARTRSRVKLDRERFHFDPETVSLKEYVYVLRFISSAQEDTNQAFLELGANLTNIKRLKKAKGEAVTSVELVSVLLSSLELFQLPESTLHLPDGFEMWAQRVEDAAENFINYPKAPKLRQLLQECCREVGPAVEAAFAECAAVVISLMKERLAQSRLTATAALNVLEDEQGSAKQGLESLTNEFKELTELLEELSQGVDDTRTSTRKEMDVVIDELRGAVKGLSNTEHARHFVSSSTARAKTTMLTAFEEGNLFVGCQQLHAIRLSAELAMGSTMTAMQGTIWNGRDVQVKSEVCRREAKALHVALVKISVDFGGTAVLRTHIACLGDAIVKWESASAAIGDQGGDTSGHRTAIVSARGELDSAMKAACDAGILQMIRASKSGSLDSMLAWLAARRAKVAEYSHLAINSKDGSEVAILSEVTQSEVSSICRGLVTAGNACSLGHKFSRYSRVIDQGCSKLSVSLSAIVAHPDGENARVRAKSSSSDLLVLIDEAMDALSEGILRQRLAEFIRRQKSLAPYFARFNGKIRDQKDARWLAEAEDEAAGAAKLLAEILKDNVTGEAGMHQLAMAKKRVDAALSSFSSQLRELEKGEDVAAAVASVAGDLQSELTHAFIVAAHLLVGQSITALHLLDGATLDELFAPLIKMPLNVDEVGNARDAVLDAVHDVCSALGHLRSGYGGVMSVFADKAVEIIKPMSWNLDSATNTFIADVDTSTEESVAHRALNLRDGLESVVRFGRDLGLGTEMDDYFEQSHKLDLNCEVMREDGGNKATLRNSASNATRKLDTLEKSAKKAKHVGTWDLLLHASRTRLEDSVATASDNIEPGSAVVFKVQEAVVCADSCVKNFARADVMRILEDAHDLDVLDKMFKLDRNVIYGQKQAADAGVERFLGILRHFETITKSDTWRGRIEEMRARVQTARENLGGCLDALPTTIPSTDKGKAAAEVKEDEARAAVSELQSSLDASFKISIDVGQSELVAEMLNITNSLASLTLADLSDVGETEKKIAALLRDASNTAQLLLGLADTYITGPVADGLRARARDLMALEKKVRKARRKYLDNPADPAARGELLAAAGQLAALLQSTAAAAMELQAARINLENNPGDAAAIARLRAAEMEMGGARDKYGTSGEEEGLPDPPSFDQAIADSMTILRSDAMTAPGSCLRTAMQARGKISAAAAALRSEAALCDNAERARALLQQADRLDASAASVVTSARYYSENPSDADAKNALDEDIKRTLAELAASTMYPVDPATAMQDLREALGSGSRSSMLKAGTVIVAELYRLSNTLKHLANDKTIDAATAKLLNRAGVECANAADELAHALQAYRDNPSAANKARLEEAARRAERAHERAQALVALTNDIAAARALETIARDLAKTQQRAEGGDLEGSKPHASSLSSAGISAIAGSSQCDRADVGRSKSTLAFSVEQLGREQTHKEGLLSISNARLAVECGERGVRAGIVRASCESLASCARSTTAHLTAGTPGEPETTAALLLEGDTALAALRAIQNFTHGHERRAAAQTRASLHAAHQQLAGAIDLGTDVTSASRELEAALHEASKKASYEHVRSLAASIMEGRHSVQRELTVALKDNASPDDVVSACNQALRDAMLMKESTEALSNLLDDERLANRLHVRLEYLTRVIGQLSADTDHYERIPTAPGALERVHASFNRLAFVCDDLAEASRGVLRDSAKVRMDAAVQRLTDDGGCSELGDAEAVVSAVDEVAVNVNTRDTDKATISRAKDTLLKVDDIPAPKGHEGAHSIANSVNATYAQWAVEDACSFDLFALIRNNNDYMNTLEEQRISVGGVAALADLGEHAALKAMATADALDTAALNEPSSREALQALSRRLSAHAVSLSTVLAHDSAALRDSDIARLKADMTAATTAMTQAEEEMKKAERKHQHNRLARAKMQIDKMVDAASSADALGTIEGAAASASILNLVDAFVSAYSTVYVDDAKETAAVSKKIRGAGGTAEDMCKAWGMDADNESSKGAARTALLKLKKAVAAALGEFTENPAELAEAIAMASARAQNCRTTDDLIKEAQMLLEACDALGKVAMTGTAAAAQRRLHADAMLIKKMLENPPTDARSADALAAVMRATAIRAGIVVTAMKCDAFHNAHGAVVALAHNKSSGQGELTGKLEDLIAKAGDCAFSLAEAVAEAEFCRGGAGVEEAVGTLRIVAREIASGSSALTLQESEVPVKTWKAALATYDNLSAMQCTVASMARAVALVHLLNGARTRATGSLFEVNSEATAHAFTSDLSIVGLAREVLVIIEELASLPWDLHVEAPSVAFTNTCAESCVDLTKLSSTLVDSDNMSPSALSEIVAQTDTAAHSWEEMLIAFLRNDVARALEKLDTYCSDISDTNLEVVCQHVDALILRAHLDASLCKDGSSTAMLTSVRTLLQRELQPAEVAPFDYDGKMALIEMDRKSQADEIHKRFSSEISELSGPRVHTCPRCSVRVLEADAVEHEEGHAAVTAAIARLSSATPDVGITLGGQMCNVCHCWILPEDVDPHMDMHAKAAAAKQSMASATISDLGLSTLTKTECAECGLFLLPQDQKAHVQMHVVAEKARAVLSKCTPVVGAMVEAKDDGTDGVSIGRVTRDLPAQLAGLKIFDVIMMWGGYVVESPSDFKAIFHKTCTPGAEVEVIVRGRGGREAERACTVVVGAKGLDSRKFEKLQRDLQELDGANAHAVAEQLAHGGGIVVSNVARGSLAHRAGFAKDDHIIAWNKKPLRGVSEFTEQLSTLTPDKTAEVTVTRPVPGSEVRGEWVLLLKGDYAGISTEELASMKRAVSQQTLYHNKASEGAAAIPLVSRVSPPATGIAKVGDGVISLRGDRIKDVESFRSALARCEIGSTVEVTLTRNGEEDTRIIPVVMEGLSPQEVQRLRRVEDDFKSSTSAHVQRANKAVHADAANSSTATTMRDRERVEALEKVAHNTRARLKELNAERDAQDSSVPSARPSKPGFSTRTNEREVIVRMQELLRRSAEDACVRSLDGLLRLATSNTTTLTDTCDTLVASLRARTSLATSQSLITFGIVGMCATGGRVHRMRDGWTGSFNTSVAPVLRAPVEPLHVESAEIMKACEATLSSSANLRAVVGKAKTHPANKDAKEALTYVAGHSRVEVERLLAAIQQQRLDCLHQELHHAIHEALEALAGCSRRVGTADDEIACGLVASSRVAYVNMLLDALGDDGIGQPALENVRPALDAFDASVALYMEEPSDQKREDVHVKAQALDAALRKRGPSKDDLQRAAATKLQAMWKTYMHSHRSTGLPGLQWFRGTVPIIVGKVFVEGGGASEFIGRAIAVVVLRRLLRPILRDMQHIRITPYEFIVVCSTYSDAVLRALECVDVVNAFAKQQAADNRLGLGLSLAVGLRQDVFYDQIGRQLYGADLCTTGAPVKGSVVITSHLRRLLAASLDNVEMTETTDVSTTSPAGVQTHAFYVSHRRPLSVDVDLTTFVSNAPKSVRPHRDRLEELCTLTATFSPDSAPFGEATATVNGKCVWQRAVVSIVMDSTKVVNPRWAPPSGRCVDVSRQLAKKAQAATIAEDSPSEKTSRKQKQNAKVPDVDGLMGGRYLFVPTAKLLGSMLDKACVEKENADVHRTGRLCATFSSPANAISVAKNIAKQWNAHIGADSEDCVLGIAVTYGELFYLPLAGVFWGDSVERGHRLVHGAPKELINTPSMPVFATPEVLDDGHSFTESFNWKWCKQQEKGFVVVGTPL